jgi:hypothetical protein
MLDISATYNNKAFEGYNMDKLYLTGVTWAEFSSLEVAVIMLSSHVAVKQNRLT